MDLTDVHKAQVSRFLSFAKGRRDRSFADHESQKEEYKSDRLSDRSAIFAATDVEAIIDEYSSMVRSHLHDEFERMASLSGVYITSCLEEAQRCGVTLQTEDISALEDQERLNQVAELAAFKASMPAATRRGTTLPQLGVTSGADPNVVQEVNDLREDNRQMRDRHDQMQREVQQLLSERTQLSSELESVKIRLKSMIARNPESTGSQNAAEIEKELSMVQASLARSNAECEQMKRDLTQRLGDSTQFRDLKSLVKKKSDEVKYLKQIMLNHGLQPPSSDGGIELAPEDD